MNRAQRRQAARAKSAPKPERSHIAEQCRHGNVTFGEGPHRAREHATKENVQRMGLWLPDSEEAPF